ncbi:MAG: Zn-dependent hydrolase [Kaistia sp. SCN 65-12]|nr:MAG: Zn-dependent hydrolase [Kaistia sp. SCN 65-12]
MSIYSIWVLEYAFIPEMPLSALVYGEHNKGTCKLPYAYTLLKSDEHTILIDCGHDDAAYGKFLADRSGVVNFAAPREVLAEVGMTPEDIDHVIITHAHFDHMGGLALFPNATFHIQETELSRWIWAMSLDRRFRWLMRTTDPGDILRCVELARDGRLVSVNGDREDVFPGIDLRIAADTHTPGSQFVVIRNDGRRESEDSFVITGDLVYRMENLHGGEPDDPFYRPVGMGIGSQTNMVLALDAIVRAAGGDPARVVPPHEARLPEIFPSRITERGLNVIEVALADGAMSQVRR